MITTTGTCSLFIYGENRMEPRCTDGDIYGHKHISFYSRSPVL